MKINKIILGMFMMITMISSVFAVTITSTSPNDSEVIKGVDSESFTAITDAVVGTVYIDGYGYPLTCDGTQCQTTVDLSMVGDNTNHQLFWILDSEFYPTFPTTHTISISRDPAKVSGLVASSISETEIQLDWTANIESDIDYYNIYKDSSLFDQTTIEEFIDSGLTIGNTHCYEIRAVDTDGNEGEASDESCALVQDLTPPTEPSITNTESDITPIDTNIIYGEDVNLKIMYGATEIEDLGTGMNFVFSTSPTNYGTKFYQAVACDSYDNCRTTNFQVTYQGAPVDLDADIVDVPFWNEPIYTMEKGTAIADGDDYWVLKAELQYYNYCNIRPSMSDINSASGAVMLVNEDIQPATSCNPEALVLDYYLDNTPDLLQASLDGTCVDLDPSGYINKEIYFKIPVGAGSPVDTYSWSMFWDGEVC